MNNSKNWSKMTKEEQQEEWRNLPIEEKKARIIEGVRKLEKIYGPFVSDEQIDLWVEELRKDPEYPVAAKITIACPPFPKK